MPYRVQIVSCIRRCARCGGLLCPESLPVQQAPTTRLIGLGRPQGAPRSGLFPGVAHAFAPPCPAAAARCAAENAARALRNALQPAGLDASGTGQPGRRRAGGGGRGVLGDAGTRWAGPIEWCLLPPLSCSLFLPAHPSPNPPKSSTMAGMRWQGS